MPNHDQFIEGACFKRGQFFMKVIKRPSNITYRTGMAEVFFGDIVEYFETVVVQRQTSPPLTQIQKHYLLSDWINEPISEEEFDKEYKEALQIINESTYSITKI